MFSKKIETDNLFTDLTPWVSENLPEDFSGVAMVYTPHTTAAVALLEDELLHLVDVRFFLDAMAPVQKIPEGSHRNSKYLHDMISLRNDVPHDERVNGHSHIRSLFFSSSQSFPVRAGVPLLGEWKKVFFVELDPIRSREVFLILTAEAAG